MNAAERAEALHLGEPAECPRCDAKLRVDRDWFGEFVTCASCGYSSSVAMASVIGKPDDDTAAIHVFGWKGGPA